MTTLKKEREGGEEQRAEKGSQEKKRMRKNGKKAKEREGNKKRSKRKKTKQKRSKRKKRKPQKEAKKEKTNKWIFINLQRISAITSNEANPKPRTFFVERMQILLRTIRKIQNKTIENMGNFRLN